MIVVRKGSWFRRFMTIYPNYNPYPRFYWSLTSAIKDAAQYDRDIYSWYGFGQEWNKLDKNYFK